MAKFERYNPSNKKQDRNKNLSLDKESKIKSLTNETKLSGYKLNEVMHDEYEGPLTDEPTQLNG
tara:strand:+ start:508 stop:699 length:192 start_codon:yes stop_codon:yes gene_type:complete